MTRPDRFSPTEQRIMNLLADGLWHDRREIKLLIGDELAGMQNVSKHILSAKKKIAKSQDVLCVIIGRQIGYRWVRLLLSEE